MISHADNQNGDKRGDKGGGVPAKPARVSRHLQYLNRLMDTGELTADGLDQAEKFCRSILAADPVEDGISARDCNNAAKTLASIAKLKADVAIGLDRMDRLDRDLPTDNQRVRIVYEEESGRVW